MNISKRPALADQNEKMSATLDRFAAKAAGLEEALKRASAENKALTTVMPPAIQTAEIAGSFGAAFESLIIISEAIDKARASNMLAGRMSGLELDQINAAVEEIEALVQTSYEGKRPSFPRLNKRIQKLKDSKNTAGK